jgi:uncharacterized membrane protein YkvA (DUF1232 family)
MDNMKRMSFVPNVRGVWRFFIDPKTDWKPKLLVVLALLYLLWPLDLLPDVAPILGWLDDIGFIGLATWYLVSASEKHLR